MPGSALEHLNSHLKTGQKVCIFVLTITKWLNKKSIDNSTSFECSKSYIYSTVWDNS